MKTQTITEVSVRCENLFEDTFHTFLKVGELYVETRQIMGAYGVSTVPFGNARNIIADTPLQAAKKVQADYDYLLANGKKLSAPIPDSYISRFGTGME